MPITISNFDSSFDRKKRFNKKSFLTQNYFDIGDVISFGPCDWIIIDKKADFLYPKDTTVTLISKSILFYSIMRSTLSKDFKIEDTIMALNNEIFLNSLFIQEEQELILGSTFYHSLDANINSIVKKVSLPDYYDIQKLDEISKKLNKNFLSAKYDVFDDIIRICGGNPYEIENPCNSWWIMPFNAKYNVIDSNGKIAKSNGGVHGIRPLINLNITLS